MSEGTGAPIIEGQAKPTNWMDEFDRDCFRAGLLGLIKEGAALWPFGHFLPSLCLSHHSSISLKTSLSSISFRQADLQRAWSGPFRRWSRGRPINY